MGTVKPDDYADMDLFDLAISAGDDEDSQTELLHRAFPDMYATETKDIAMGAAGMGAHTTDRAIGTVTESQVTSKKRKKRVRGLAYRRRPSLP